jgi:hypothetical protein
MSPLELIGLIASVIAICELLYKVVVYLTKRIFHRSSSVILVCPGNHDLLESSPKKTRSFYENVKRKITTYISLFLKKSFAESPVGICPRQYRFYL